MNATTVTSSEWFDVHETASEVRVHPDTVRYAVKKLGGEIRHTHRGVGRTAKLLIHADGVRRLKELYPDVGGVRRDKNTSAMRT